jgi:hypothetical protein
MGIIKADGGKLKKALFCRNLLLKAVKRARVS